MGPDALHDLPRAVTRLRARVADTVQLVDGRRRGLVRLDPSIDIDGSGEFHRDLSAVLPAHGARAMGERLPVLADDAEADVLG